MSVFRDVVALLRSSHPEPALAVTTGTAILAVSTGRSAAGVVAVAATVAASQLAVGWHNDWLDADRDRASGRADKPIATGAISRRMVGACAVLAAVATVPLAFLSGPTAALAAIVGLLSSLSYNWPLKFTTLSVLPYVISFAALPAFVVLGRPGSPPPPWWLIAAGASLGGGAHFANVLSDLDDDARIRGTGAATPAGSRGRHRGRRHRDGRGQRPAGVRADRTGRPGSWPGVALALGVLFIGGVGQLRRPASRIAFRAVLVAALIDVVLLLTSGSIV